MELALPTTVSQPPSLEWCLCTSRRTQGAKVAKAAVHQLKEKARPSVGHAARCVGKLEKGIITLTVFLALAIGWEGVGAGVGKQPLLLKLNNWLTIGISMDTL